jgi:hypothetical protein
MKCHAGWVKFGCNTDATLVPHYLKRNKFVVLLSSEHTEPDIDAIIGKLEAILAYNSTKGVDHLDQMRGA